MIDSFIMIEEKAKSEVDEGIEDMRHMTAYEKLLYMAIKYQYIAYIRSAALPKQIAEDKRNLAVAYEDVRMDQERYLTAARHRTRIGSELVKLERCGCKYCQTMIRLFDNRELFSRVEAEEQEQV